MNKTQRSVEAVIAFSRWLILPMLLGLVVGLGLSYWAPAAAGSGIPQVKVAFSLRSGLVSFKETIAKFVLCSLQIGSGASLGLEGPTVQICAGVSSMLARAARLSPGYSRRMASVGMAAGIAAAFNAPIAAITFTLEELIGDLDQTMLSGVIVAAATVFGNPAIELSSSVLADDGGAINPSHTGSPGR